MNERLHHYFLFKWITIVFVQNEKQIETVSGSNNQSRLHSPLGGPPPLPGECPKAPVYDLGICGGPLGGGPLGGGPLGGGPLGGGPLGGGPLGGGPRGGGPSQM